jgi:hypothetical protein
MILQALSALALREVIESGMKAGSLPDANADGGGIIGLFVRRFADGGQKLPKALRHCSDCAWRALELALAKDGLGNWLDTAESRAFREQVRGFLKSPAAQLAGIDAACRHRAWRELRYARKDGLLSGVIDMKALPGEALALIRHHDPAQVIRAQWAAVDGIADVVEKAGYLHLGRILRLRPDGEASLLVMAARYFFRRAIETEPVLFQGLTYGRLESVAHRQDAGFAALAQLLDRNDEALEEQLALLGDLRSDMREIRADLARLDIRDEQARVGAEVHQLHLDVLQIKELLTGRAAVACLPTSTSAEPAVTRTHGELTLRWRGHEVHVACDVWTNQATIHHDGRLQSSGEPRPESAFAFEVVEDGLTARYEVIVRGPGASFLAKPYFTVRRNDQVLFDDRAGAPARLS